jgi:hypothetical protein
MAELVSFAFSMYVLNRKHAVALGGSVPYVSLVAGLIPLLILLNHFLAPFDGMIFTRVLFSMAIMGVVSVGILLLMGETYRKNLLQLFRNMGNDIRI